MEKHGFMHKDIIVFRGDDTDFVGNREIIIHICTERSLEGCSAYFKLLDYERNFDTIPEDGNISIVLSGDVTKNFPVGIANGELWLIDENGRKRTLANRLHFIITNCVEEAYCGCDPQRIGVTVFGERIVKSVNGYRPDQHGDVVIPAVGTMKRIDGYLYEIDGMTIDEAVGEYYFREMFGKSRRNPFGACSCFRVGNKFARAYDWRYDDAVSFVVRTKPSGTTYASIAVCRSPEGMTKSDVESRSATPKQWMTMPFLALDGINENGVTCCVNVVKAKEGVVWQGKDFCAVGAVRRVLDHARSAEEGAAIIRDGAWMPDAEKMGGYSLHFMVTDAEKTLIVEDGKIVDYTEESAKAMTNFRVDGDFREAGYASAGKIADYDPYGSGVERYNSIVDFIEDGEVPVREWLTAFKYSGAYASRETPRPSDFAGVEIEQGVIARIDDFEEIGKWFVNNDIHNKWLARTRDGEFWQTVHSSVYTLDTFSLDIVVQEQGTVYSFPLVISEGEPADYSTVRANAAKGASHAETKGNPHETDANDIPFNEDMTTGEAIGQLLSDTQSAMEQAGRAEEAAGHAEEAAGEARDLADTAQSTANEAIGVANAAAQDVGDLDSLVTDHIDSESIHVSEEDRENWDDKYTQQEVDDKITRVAAHYLTWKDDDGRFVPFTSHGDAENPEKGSLVWAKKNHTKSNPQFFYAKTGFTPTEHDYCIVLDDETMDHKTTRYAFVGVWPNGSWQYQYTINDTAFSQEQWAAINSRVSANGDVLLFKTKQVALKQDVPTEDDISRIVTDKVKDKRDLTNMDVYGLGDKWYVEFTGGDTPPEGFAEHVARSACPYWSPHYEWDEEEEREVEVGGWEVPSTEFNGVYYDTYHAGWEIDEDGVKDRIDAGFVSEETGDIYLCVFTRKKEKVVSKLATEKQVEAVGKDIANKRDKDDNVCHKTTLDDKWTFSGDGYDPNTRYEVRIETYEEWGLRDYDLYIDGGYAETYEDSIDAPIKDHVDFWENYITADRSALAKDGETFITPSALSDIKSAVGSISGKRDKTDNICHRTDDGWTHPESIGSPFDDHTFDWSQPSYDGSTWMWFDDQGYVWWGPEDASATSGEFMLDDDMSVSFESRKLNYAYNNESFVTETGVSNIFNKKIGESYTSQEFANAVNAIFSDGEKERF